MVFCFMPIIDHHLIQEPLALTNGSEMSNSLGVASTTPSKRSKDDGSYYTS